MSHLSNPCTPAHRFTRRIAWLLQVAALVLLDIGHQHRDLAADELKQPIRSPAQFERAIAAARPGEAITIANGRYDGWKLNVPATVSGASGRMISIRPETLGGVVLTGESDVHIGGDYVEVADLVFEGTGAPSVTIHGDHNRVTRVNFIGAGTRTNTHRPILRIESPASDNEIDHCEFLGSASVSIQVKAHPDEGRGLPLRNNIHHNLFKDIPRYSKNGQEPIQLKCRAGRACELLTRVEYNSFVRADGDSELISVKSSRNLIRYNVALDSNGGISLRAGNDNLVDGNVLIRTKAGIVITGNRQTVVNNFIDQPRLEGILIAIGSKRFRAATDAVVAHNTIIRAEAPIRFNLRDPVATDMPRNNKIVNNIFVAQRSSEEVISAKAPNGLEEYLSINDVQRNLFWWHDGGNGHAASQIYRSNENIVADPRLDLSDPRMPRLGTDSPARHRAIPGFAATDLIGAPRGTADMPDLGAVEDSAADGE